MTKHNDDVQPAATKSVPTPQELLDAHLKWWKERVEQAKEAEGWDGRDLRNQSELIGMCMGMEQDITFLLRYVRSLTEHIDLVGIRPEDRTGFVESAHKSNQKGQS